MTLAPNAKVVRELRPGHPRSSSISQPKHLSTGTACGRLTRIVYRDFELNQQSAREPVSGPRPVGFVVIVVLVVVVLSVVVRVVIVVVVRRPPSRRRVRASREQLMPQIPRIPEIPLIPRMPQFPQFPILPILRIPLIRILLILQIAEF